MIKVVLAWLAGAIMGTAFGVALGFLAYPYVFAPPTATETLTSEESARPVAKGQFIHANPSDPIHYGKGSATIYERTAFLHADFEVGPGPAFHVYLVPKANIRTSDDVKGTMFVDLGKIKSFKGSQKYPIPAGVDLRNYPSLVIFCEQFQVLISPADLGPVG